VENDNSKNDDEVVGEKKNDEFSTNHCCNNHCFCYRPQSPRRPTDHTGPDPRPPSLTGGSRARQMGMGLGRILGVVVSGLLATRGLRKKQVVEENDGRGYSIEKDGMEDDER